MASIDTNQPNTGQRSKSQKAQLSPYTPSQPNLRAARSAESLLPSLTYDSSSSPEGSSSPNQTLQNMSSFSDPWDEEHSATLSSSNSRLRPQRSMLQMYSPRSTVYVQTIRRQYRYTYSRRPPAKLGCFQEASHSGRVESSSSTRWLSVSELYQFTGRLALGVWIQCSRG